LFGQSSDRALLIRGRGEFPDPERSVRL
jgi:hypothetical protein